jgi:hypothetical protein
MNHELLLQATVALLNKLHGWPMPGLRDEYLAAMLAVQDSTEIVGGKLVIKSEAHHGL